MDQSIDRMAEDETSVPWLWRTLLAIELWARPAWGWGVLVACMLLAMLPAVSLRANKWITLGSFQGTLELAGPLAVAVVWYLIGWRQQAQRRLGWLALVLGLVIGALALSQLL